MTQLIRDSLPLSQPNLDAEQTQSSLATAESLMSGASAVSVVAMVDAPVKGSAPAAPVETLQSERWKQGSVAKLPPGTPAFMRPAMTSCPATV